MLSCKGIYPSKSKKLSTFGYDTEEQEKIFTLLVPRTKNSDKIILLYGAQEEK